MILMKLPKRSLLSAGQRMVADAIMVASGTALAFALRFLYLAYLGRQGLVSQQFVSFTLDESIRVFGHLTWLLVVVCLLTFWLYGFYEHCFNANVRAYRGKNKFLAILQAVSAAFLVFVLVSYLQPLEKPFPRSVLIGAWILTLMFFQASRLWSHLWRGAARIESRMYKEPPKTIHSVLVIGGAGYIGSALLPKLLAEGFYVRLLDLLIYGREPIQSLLGHPRLEVLQGDFRQVDKVVDAMRAMDAVIHLGAIVGDPACALDEDLTIDINLMATRMIAEVAKGSGVNRFIFASTCSVYGACDQILNEESELNPVSLYARSKIASERVLNQLADEHFAPVILRFGTIYGLSGRTRFDLVINLLTAKALAEGEITIFGGQQWRPFVHVDDAALSILKALEAPLEVVRNQAFNVGSNRHNYTISQIGEIIQKLIPSAKVSDKEGDSDRRNYRVNFDKIHDLLNFNSKWSVEDGVRQVIEAIQSGRITDYRDSIYSNVKFLNEEGGFRLMRRENSWAAELIRDTTPIHTPKH